MTVWQWFLLEVQDIRSATQQLVTTHHSTTGCAFAKVAPFVWPHGTSEMLKDYQCPPNCEHPVSHDPNLPKNCI